MRRLALLALLSFAVGCGSQTSGHATVWVTRDRGAVVVRSATVPAGLTAMQGLERAVKVSTRYGGRYVRSVEGVSEHGRSSWFYYVNGYLADRSAAEYKLRPGDVEWWDFRSWGDPAQDPVVVGAFPEPFLHGYDGKVRPAVVIGPGAAALAPVVHGRVAAHAPKGANVLRLGPGPTRFSARLLADGAVELTYTGDAAALARRPSAYRYRYSVP